MVLILVPVLVLIKYCNPGSANQPLMTSFSCCSRKISHMTFMAQVIGSSVAWTQHHYFTVNLESFFYTFVVEIWCVNLEWLFKYITRY